MTQSQSEYGAGIGFAAGLIIGLPGMALTLGLILNTVGSQKAWPSPPALILFYFVWVGLIWAINRLLKSRAFTFGFLIAFPIPTIIILLMIVASGQHGL